MAELKIADLAEIEFVNSTSIAQYSRKGRDIGRELASELEFGAHALRGVLEAQTDNPLIAALGMDFQTKVRARHVAVHLKRASDTANAMALELAKLNGAYQKLFAPALEGHRRKQPAKKFDFDQ